MIHGLRKLLLSDAFHKAIFALAVVWALAFISGFTTNPMSQQLFAILPDSVAFTSLMRFGAYLLMVGLVLGSIMLINAIKREKYDWQLLITTILIFTFTMAFNAAWGINRIPALASFLLFIVVYIGTQLQR